MKIIACVRQTPDTETLIKIGGDAKSIDTNGVKYVLGPYDEYALEAAVQIKEKSSGNVTAVSVGPARVTETLRQCLAVGADAAVHINTDGNETDDALVLAKALAEQIKKIGDYDIVFTSNRGADSGTDRITDFEQGSDLIRLTAQPGGFASLTIEDRNAHLAITHDGGTVVLEHLAGTTLTEADFTFL